jgi:hypothetical protein
MYCLSSWQYVETSAIVAEGGREFKRENRCSWLRKEDAGFPGYPGKPS